MKGITRILASWTGVILAAFLTSVGAIIVACGLAYLMYDAGHRPQAMRNTPFIAFFTAFPFCIFVWAQVRTNIQLQQELQKLVNIDRLTRVGTRDFFFGTLSDRGAVDGAVLMVDIDRFKNVNDSFGHLAGDAVIRMTADILRSGLRDSDLVARFGGEEFVIFLDGRDMDAAFQVAERLREGVADTAVVFGGQRISTSVSIGIATCSDDVPLTRAIQEADAALYKAKSGGRNRSVRSTGSLAAEAPQNLSASGERMQV